eukprot:CAMPEP_0113581496 /NCGR_PEP_ID=MMETSP0015_2-20120614/31333_1 /TAXON_ID=2838 /ORGANISM="Odontella" /LENGTH=291 /DNA_ID=CAMNT_0000485947 /DNA_START=179 /DNA_END=1054 /DNA_ORIENTATION=+ /assembly_acc=CAM_ASM_000160
MTQTVRGQPPISSTSASTSRKLVVHRTVPLSRRRSHSLDGASAVRNLAERGEGTENPRTSGLGSWKDLLSLGESISSHRPSRNMAGNNSSSSLQYSLDFDDDVDDEESVRLGPDDEYEATLKPQIGAAGGLSVVRGHWSFSSAALDLAGVDELRIRLVEDSGFDPAGRNSLLARLSPPSHASSGEMSLDLPDIFELTNRSRGAAEDAVADNNGERDDDDDDGFGAARCRRESESGGTSTTSSLMESLWYSDEDLLAPRGISHRRASPLSKSSCLTYSSDSAMSLIGTRIEI